MVTITNIPNDAVYLHIPKSNYNAFMLLLEYCADEDFKIKKIINDTKKETIKVSFFMSEYPQIVSCKKYINSNL